MIAPYKLERFKVTAEELIKFGAEFNLEALPLVSKLHTASFWILLDKKITKKIIKQTFTEAIQYCNVTKNDASWEDWILRIWMREIIDYCKSKENNSQTNFDFIDHANISSHLELLISDSTNIKSASNENQLISILGSLPKVLCIPVIMKEVLHFRYEKIAELIDVPNGVIATRIYRARKLLYLFLDKSFSYEQEKSKWQFLQPSKKIFEVRKCALFVDEEMGSEEKMMFSKSVQNNPEYQSELIVQQEAKKIFLNCSPDNSSISEITSKIDGISNKKFSNK